MREKARALYADNLFQNSFYMMLATGAMAASGFVFWLLAARLYSPEDVGIASTLISAMNFIAYAALLGFNGTFIRYLPKSKTRNEHIDTGLLLVGGMSLLIASLYVSIAPHLVYHLGILYEHWYFSLVFIVLVTGCAVNLVTDSIYVAYRQSKFNFLINGIAGSVTQIVLALVLVSFAAFGIFAASGSGMTIAMVLSIIILMRKFHYTPRLKISRLALREVMRFSFANYIASLFNILPTIALPMIVLSRLGAAEAGYFYLAFMMSNLLFTVAYSVAQSLFAEGSYNELDMSLLARRAAKIMGVIMIPAAAALALLGPFILKAFGSEYGASARGLIIVLAASSLLVGIFVVCSVLLKVKKAMGRLIVADAFFALSVCGLAWAWSGKGLVWVGIAWLVGHGLTLLFVGAFLLRGLGDSPLSRAEGRV